MNELLYIISSSLSSDEIEKTIKSIETLLKESFSAEIVLHKIWLKRKLSYPIRGVSHGHFVLCYFKAKPQKIEEINKEFLIKPNILRHIIVKTDLKTVKEINQTTKELSKEVYIDKEKPGQERRKEQRPIAKTEPQVKEKIIKTKESIKSAVKPEIEKKVEPKNKEKIDLSDLDKKLDNLLEEEGISL